MITSVTMLGKYNYVKFALIFRFYIVNYLTMT